MLKIFFLALLLLFFGMKEASAENISKGKITRITVTELSVTVVQENATYPKKCEITDYFSVPRLSGRATSESGGQYVMLQPLLIAYQSGLSVRLKTDSCRYGGSAKVMEVTLE